MTTTSSSSSSPSTFPCTKCGACCKMLHDPLAFTYFRASGLALPNGTCKHLQPDNTCGVYDNRPLLCNFERVYQEAKLVEIMPLEGWHANIAHTSCAISVHEHGGELPNVKSTPSGAFILCAANARIQEIAYEQLLEVHQTKSNIKS